MLGIKQNNPLSLRKVFSVVSPLLFFVEFAISRYGDIKWPQGGATGSDRRPGRT